MKLHTSQGDVIIDIPEEYTKIGIKISGGADSALLAYMLALYKKHERDVDLIPITVINAIKPHQHIFAQRVVKFVEDKLSVKFNHHQIKPEPVDPQRYGEEQSIFVRSLRKQEIIETHFTGITENPDVELKTDYTGDSTRNKDLGSKPTRDLYSFHPFANINKKAIAELYESYGLMDTLFAITRSCENSKIHFTEPHCGKCWWCLERQWGFGRLE
jgi:hypothetical protein